MNENFIERPLKFLESLLLCGYIDFLIRGDLSFVEFVVMMRIFIGGFDGKLYSPKYSFTLEARKRPRLDLLEAESRTKGR